MPSSAWFWHCVATTIGTALGILIALPLAFGIASWLESRRFR